VTRPWLGGCGVLIARGSYCATCRRLRDRARRGSSAEQARFRRVTFERTDGRCTRCGRPADFAHHDPPVSEGGAEATEGEALCGRCHRQAHH
jgi:5-methylcytosine-specific restriction endonuclease McrA